MAAETGFKTGGFFVEFGATDGIEGSNTHLLENSLGWSGILAEPCRSWHGDLSKNRSCVVDQRCVWRTSGEYVRFRETKAAAVSTIDSFASADYLASEREDFTAYDVATVSLRDLLLEHGAPKTIDYLSIDTEGSELDILTAFDFSEFDVKIISCEHNFTPAQDAILDLLTSQGYVRKHERFSQYDDWYVKA